MIDIQKWLNGIFIFMILIMFLMSIKLWNTLEELEYNLDQVKFKYMEVSERTSINNRFYRLEKYIARDSLKEFIDNEIDEDLLKSYWWISFDWYPMLWEGWYFHEIRNEWLVCVKDRAWDKDCVYQYNRNIN